MAKRSEAFYPERIENGRFVTTPVLQLIRSFEGKQVEVCIRAKRSYTTLPQMRYYRGVVIKWVADEMRARGGEGPSGGPITDQEVHQMFAGKFLKRSVVIDAETGECEDLPLSTADATIGEMSEYIERIKVWAHIFDREKSNDDGTTEIIPFIIPEAGEQLSYV